MEARTITNKFGGSLLLVIVWAFLGSVRESSCWPSKVYIDHGYYNMLTTRASAVVAMLAANRTVTMTCQSYSPREKGTDLAFEWECRGSMHLNGSEQAWTHCGHEKRLQVTINDIAGCHNPAESMRHFRCIVRTTGANFTNSVTSGTTIGSPR